MMSKNKIINFFEEALSDINCQNDTKSYIVGIYGKYISATHDLSKDSITLLFAQARNNHDFFAYQNLGDWIFYKNTIFKDDSINKEYYDTIARLSYNSCYKLINKKWKLFEELSDNLIKIEYEVKNKLTPIYIHND